MLRAVFPCNTRRVGQIKHGKQSNLAVQGRNLLHHHAHFRHGSNQAQEAVHLSVEGRTLLQIMPMLGNTQGVSGIMFICMILYTEQPLV